MAYTSPRTWVTGEYPTAAQFNANVRDNLNAAFPLGVDAWTTWVPTLTNLTLGNGTVTARYQRIGRTIHYYFKFELGSTSVVGIDPLFTFPVTPRTGTAQIEVDGTGKLRDSGTADYQCQVWRQSATEGRIVTWNSAGTYIAAAAITATVPFIWTTGDSIVVTGTYEAAA